MGILCCLADPVDFDAEITLFHFNLHRAIGKGAFGKVRVVEHKKTKKLYALKYINKRQCVSQKAVANVIQERQLLEEVDHPFVVNLRYAFQDDQNCFFALDLMLGGDLRFHLERKGMLAEPVVQFWVAELASAITYLHKQRIIHRDIKPDNILLDIRGHAHLTDFNVAIHYSSTRLHTSVAGSLAYMAPEVCGRKGYSWQVDWWSLGVCAYELILGRRPFEGRSGEALTASIVKDPLRVPERVKELCSDAGLSALKQLLEKDKKKRLGCRSETLDMEHVKSHPWLAGIDWANLEKKELQAPFIPDERKGNFDITHELDEFLMVEKPLTATKRKQNVDLDKLGPEYRQLEEQFTNFDYTQPKRMSYYPNNQPISVNVPQAQGNSAHPESDYAVGEESLDMPRSSSHSNTLTVGVTTVAEDSVKGSPIDSPSPPHPGLDHAQQQHQQQQQYQQQQQAYQDQLAYQQAYGGIMSPPVPSMSLPVTPDRAMVRPRPSADGSASYHGSVHGQGQGQGQPTIPRMSSGSGRSVGTGVAV